MGGWDSEVIDTMDMAFLAVVCIKERWKKLSSASQHLQMIRAVAIKAEDRFIRTEMFVAGAPESENCTFAIADQSTCGLVTWTKVYL